MNKILVLVLILLVLGIGTLVMTPTVDAMVTDCYGDGYGWDAECAKAPLTHGAALWLMWQAENGF